MQDKNKSIMPKKVYIEFLRIVAAYLVIVNHTNSELFLKTKISMTWFASLTYFFLCKIAVPVFLLIMGAVLLGKQDTYRKSGKRVLRIAGILIVCSILYYLFECCTKGSAVSISVFLKRFCNQHITASFWYLYMYIGMLLMLPILQKLRAALSKKEIRFLTTLSLGVIGLAPILSAFLGIAIPNDIYTVFFHPYVSMVFAGYYLDNYCELNTRRFVAAAVTFISMIALQVVLTWRAYLNNPDHLLILDSNTSLPITLSAVSAFYMAKYAFSRIRISLHAERTICALGGMMFTVFLLSDGMIKATRFVYSYLTIHTKRMVAMVGWELVIFLLCIFLAALIKKLPVLKKIL